MILKLPSTRFNSLNCPRLIIGAIVFLLLLVPPTLYPINNISSASIIWLVIFSLGFSQWVFLKNWIKNLPVLVFVLPPIISTIMSGYYGKSTQGAIIPVLGAFLGYIMLSPYMKNERLNYIINIVLSFSLLAGFLAVFQYIYNFWPILDNISQQEFTSIAFERRSAATFGHPILYGTFCGASIILAFYLRKKWRWFIVPVNLAGILLSGSRSSLAPIVVILLLEIIHKILKILNTKRIGYGSLFVLFSTILFSLAAIYAICSKAITISARYSAINQSFSATYRTLQWEAGLKLITYSWQSLWIGHGIGGSVDLLSRGALINIWGPKTFDNSYITLLYDYGLMGVIAFGGLLLWGSLSSGKIVGRQLILFMAVNALFFDAYLWPLWIFFVILGFSLKSSHIGVKE